jgi:hypothetical protein
MATPKLALWREGRDPGECGVQIDGTRFSFEDLDEIINREEAEAAGIPVVLLDEYRGNWCLFGLWLEDEAVCGMPTTPRGSLQEFSHRLLERQRLIGSAIASLMRDGRSQPEPRSGLPATDVAA